MTDLVIVDVQSFVHVEEQPLVTIVDGFIPVPGPPGGVTIKGELATSAICRSTGTR